jgi:hypothetical protein
LLDEIKDFFFFGIELISFNILNEYLALFKTSANLVWQPGSDWGSTSCSWVFGVINDVLLDHTPVLMSESEGSMYVLQHQKGRVTILQSKLFLLGLFLLLPDTVNILLMIIWSISSHLE